MSKRPSPSVWNGRNRRAERLVAAWEVEAARQGRDRHDDSFWRDGGRWIDEQRQRSTRATER